MVEPSFPPRAGATSRLTWARSLRRSSTSWAVRCEGAHPLAAVLVEKLTGGGAPPKPDTGMFESRRGSRNVDLIWNSVRIFYNLNDGKNKIVPQDE